MTRTGYRFQWAGVRVGAWSLLQSFRPLPGNQPVPDDLSGQLAAEMGLPEGLPGLLCGDWSAARARAPSPGLLRLTLTSFISSLLLEGSSAIKPQLHMRTEAELALGAVAVAPW